MNLFRRVSRSNTTFSLVVGVVWGLALARVLAESFPASPTFDLAPTCLVALASAAVAAAMWRRLLLPRSTGLPLLLAAIYVFWPGVAPLVGWTLLGGSIVLLFVGQDGILSKVRQDGILSKGQDTILPYMLAATTLALYLRTLGPTVGQADTFEFQVVAPTLGVAHPTGYPLYILCGKLFSLLPFGSIAWRVNLTSTVFAVAAVLVVYRLVLRISESTTLVPGAKRKGNQRVSESANERVSEFASQRIGASLAALVAALALAFSRVFWSQAIIAEVYALHNLFIAIILFILVDLITSPSPQLAIPLPLRSGDSPALPQGHPIGTLGRCWDGVAGGATPSQCPCGRDNIHYPLSTIHFPLTALLLGLSFANHLTTALLLPAVGLTLFFVRPRVSWRGLKANSVWVIAGLFLLGLSLYLYIYFRWPMLHDGVWMSPGEFWRYITGQQFGGALRLDAWYTDPTRYQIVGRLLREPFGWPGLALGAAGLAWLAIKKWRVALITGITFLAFAVYALCYYVPDVSVFLLPAHLLLAIWIGVGLTAIAGLVSSNGFPWHRPPHRPSVPVGGQVSRFILSLGVLLPMWLLWTNLPLVDQSGEREAHAWGDRVLDLPLAPGSAILADSVRIAPLYYLQHIEGRRPDMDMLVLANEALYRAELEARVAAGQTVYLARFLPGLEGRYHLRSLGPLTEVGTAPLLEPPPLDRVLGVRLGPIELLGLTGPVPGPDGGTGLTLYWRADAPVGEIYHVRLRLVDGDGQVWWQDADGGRHAVNNTYPTPAWRPGEVLSDYHEIPPLLADPATFSGGYVVQVGLFRPFSDEGLATENGETWHSLLSLDSLTQALPAPAHPLRARLGSDLTLVGADLADVIAAGAPVELALHWHADDAAPPGRPTLTWIGQQGHRAQAQVLESWGRSRLLLQSPSSPGDYCLRLGWEDADESPLPARCGWLARSTDDCALAEVRVTEAAAEALANFDAQMLLLDAESGSRVLHPGQSMAVTLHWQGLRPMADDYTVSIQLIAPDGRLYGQTDAWPVQGTLPTSQWSPGQRIADPYDVTLRADAPPGRYQVGIVVYLLATNTRLPLLDESGQVSGNIALVGELDVTKE